MRAVRSTTAATVVSCAVAVWCAPSISAQQAAAEQRGRPGGRAGAATAAPVSPAELQMMFDGYVLMQAQEALQLNEEQFPRFLGKLKALQAARRRAQAQRARAFQELRRLSAADSAPGTSGASGAGGASEEAELRRQLKALDDIDAKSAADVRQAHAELDEVLDVRQQARFRIFEENMERRKVELLMRARQAARQGNRF
jgi:hypothetical protein